ncbi:hypothetical protein [Streptomyces sp. SID11385]|uniref:hypothetical protein n=1 Tax=Streptomyces sp. SID11385 TaxID=2706031 RepID=UPI0013C7BDCD|nr:hypothetical protein [Streptomyces sp. SID11385]NEA44013.1 hypothetical protein [Streptomyces sp. SID11385]
MAVLLLPLLLLLAALWFWARPLLSGTWRSRPGWFVWTALLLLLCAVPVYLAGSLAGASLDPEEACHRAGQEYDRAYRRAHFTEYTRWFPLHDKCHAGYDLVPAWVNPVLVALPVLALLALAWAARLILVRRRSQKKGTLMHEKGTS